MKDLTNEIPYAYPMCSLTDCPLAERCLRQLAYCQLKETREVLTVVNPRFCRPGESCPNRRDSAPVTYACGFTKMQGRMYPAQYKAFKRRLVSCFGRNPFFERRNGKRPLPPKEQEIVKQAARQAGVTAAFEFDSYKSGYLWNE